ncbi:MAG TPA: ATP-dependent DNA ligase [Thermoanaerobaculia bacterium]|nr:ATP-dependent DNA ligase [Thermoanaerobaculia bacterium]
MRTAGARKSSVKKSPPEKRADEVVAGALPAEALEGDFPAIDLPVHPPFPPMEAKSVDAIPSAAPGDGGWLYEPKWDGFRCLAFRKGEQVLLQSKSCQPLGRYFPELVEALRALPVKTFVLDSEIVISREGKLSFDDLLQRIHPAESRIRKLARETPASLFAFDLLVDARGTSLVDLPLADRRERLEKLFGKLGEPESVVLSPATDERELAEQWIRDLGAGGLDGVIAKRSGEPYLSGERTGMVKIKRHRTADCVVGGFRWAHKGEKKIGSILLGLYDGQGNLDHVGFSSSFTDTERRELEEILVPLIEPPGFTGKAPGGPSRWSQGRSTEWEPLRPALVCEIRYDHFSGGRFRHGTKFLRWRPDKEPRACTYQQLERGKGDWKKGLKSLGIEV